MISQKKLLLIGTLALIAIVGIAAGIASLADVGRFRGSAGAAPTPSPSPLDLGPVIARVDGQPIYLEEARSRFAGLTTIHAGGGSDLGKEWKDRIFQSLIDDKIILAAAEDLGITYTPQELAAAVARVQEMAGGDLETWLAGQDITRAELERRLTLNQLAARVYITLTQDVKVSGAEVRDYYLIHRADYENADGSVEPFLAVRRSVREALVKQEQEQAFADWLEGQRKEADVVVIDEDWWRKAS